MTIEKIIFIVRYIRQGKTDQWKAKTTIEQGIKTHISEKAHGSFVAQWGEQKRGDQNSEEIFVPIERDPRDFDMSPELEEAQIAMLEKANQIANKEFLKRHPDANIKHSES
jgi:hypothetical protein